MHRILLLTLSILNLILNQDNVLASQPESSEISTAKEFYNQVMVPLNIKYHKIENEMMKMLIEDPVDDFIRNDQAPVSQRIDYLAENVTTGLASNGTEALRLLISIRKENENIKEETKYLDHKHKENIRLRDERKETIENKIKEYMSELKAAVALQIDLDIDEELDDDFTKKFIEDGLNITTPTAILQLKKTIRFMEKLAGDYKTKDPVDLAKDFIGSILKGPKKEFQDPYTEDEIESKSVEKYAEINEKLIQTLIQEQHNKLTPSNLVKTMLEKFKEAKEEFHTNLIWKYDSMASKYMKHAMKNIVNKYNNVIKDLDKFEEQIEAENKHLIEMIEEAKFYKKDKIKQIEKRMREEL